ncbi:tetratricopeptide repeat protein [Clostridium beijerinckii]|uniref:tetratricopeptide repeat protein n=1 Tax=Clostridium beijerinckii TaxID=1520 RepID=UPI00098CCEC2|nr:hypothetical protein [Clostridium beijerinckii]MBA8934305.1 putative nucleic acid-binding Zn-ribbon protein [Clostridium beijerinckii]NRU38497.1 putative nucleic acid-binding Zn-ribbon protein [Clostridium beijerinckii]NSA98224.1 putative nucleic acid-binding Zn-ribbon protein [Clostridium beijerinckii]OOM61731.1 beta-barrel assembly-enhancing protease [Clostridium beijerinckii]OOM68129.1 beta-barrel assembly-enhancing protease [Clostridium beijerinckii]
MEENKQSFEGYNQDYEQEICKLCGNAYIDKSESRYSTLCTNCREKQIKYPIPKLFILISIVLIFLVGSSFVQFPKIFKAYKSYATAEQKAKQGYVNDALHSLEDLTKQYTEDKSIPVLAVKISMNNGKYEYADYIIDKYLANKKVDKSIYNEITTYSKRIDQYYTTYDFYDKLIKNLDKNMTKSQSMVYVNTKLKSLLNDNKQDKALLNYYLSISAPNIKEAKEFIQASIKEDNKMLRSHIELAYILLEEKDFDGSRKKYNEILNKEKDNIDALCGLVAVEVLNGDKKAAVRYARQAYDINQKDLYAMETLMIALNEDGQTEEVNKIKDEYLSTGNKFDNTTLDYFNGKININDYYLSNGGQN